ncbi:GNAT family N-acetyltransferase [Undibacterium sp. TJN19]|uniref:GNAT family N-acetyltransferase n=1 Tax=Undibacterium sp. TJN19 TaxID=3413055 RepID=UPI003BF2A682
MNKANLRIVIADWDTLQKDAQAIRYAVFVVEQKIPAELEWDAADAQCVHAVVYDETGLALGTGRLLPDAHIGRMAVLGEARGMGIGAMILRALMAQAQQRGEKTIRLNAQQSAENFYLKEGYLRDGDIFEEAGIPHISMAYRFE